MTDDLKERIVRARLTRKESEVAEYFLSHPYEVCFMTASDVAKRLETSNTSVNRTAKALGYSVFADLQKELRQYVSTQGVRSEDNASLPPSQRILRDAGDEIQKDLFFQMHHNITVSMMQVMEKNSVEKIDQVVEMLANSHTKYINGYRNTADIASKFGFLLELVCSRVVVTSGEHVSTIARLIDAGPEDCVVVLSFNRYYQSAQDVMEMCHRQGAKIILITDRLTSPMAHLADTILLAEIDSLSFFNSNVTALFLLEVLCAKLARRLGEAANQRLDIMEPYIRGIQIE